MRKIILTATVAGAALALAACSSDSDADAVADDTVAADTAETVAPETTADAARLDPNTATAEQLGAIAGLTPELAEAIAAGRPYASVAAFDAKLRETLSEEEAAAVRASLFVPINLNTASEEEIALIPGMTPRMVHEFLEYRPYEDMAEFDREIGKYVDEAEVARLRSYVTL